MLAQADVDEAEERRRVLAAEAAHTSDETAGRITAVLRHTSEWRDEARRHAPETSAQVERMAATFEACAATALQPDATAAQRCRASEMATVCTQAMANFAHAQVRRAQRRTEELSEHVAAARADEARARARLGAARAARRERGAAAAADEVREGHRHGRVAHGRLHESLGQWCTPAKLRDDEGRHANLSTPAKLRDDGGTAPSLDLRSLQRHAHDGRRRGPTQTGAAAHCQRALLSPALPGLATDTQRGEPHSGAAETAASAHPRGRIRGSSTRVNESGAQRAVRQPMALQHPPESSSPAQSKARPPRRRITGAGAAYSRDAPERQARRHASPLPRSVNERVRDSPLSEEDVEALLDAPVAVTLYDFNDLLLRVRDADAQLLRTIPADQWARMVADAPSRPMFAQIDGKPAVLSDLLRPKRRLHYYGDAGPAFGAFHLGGERPEVRMAERSDLSTLAAYGAPPGGGNDAAPPFIAGREQTAHVRVLVPATRRARAAALGGALEEEGGMLRI